MAGSYRSEVPGIGACTPQDSPPEEIQNLHELGYFTEMSYRSPQGELELRLDHGNEFRMGCEVWYRTRIFESGRDRSGRHPELLKYLEENHPYSMTGLHPWNRVGDKIAMPTVSNSRCWVHALRREALSPCVFVARSSMAWVCLVTLP